VKDEICLDHDVLALAWPESHGFGFPKSARAARPFGFGLSHGFSSWQGTWMKFDFGLTKSQVIG
jgi:hypothetical protein